MPKWVKQILFSIAMLILMLAVLYTSGKEAGTLDLFYDFLILVTAMAYIISIFCVSYDAEIRGVSVFWISLVCTCLPIAAHLAWYLLRPSAQYSFAEYLMQEKPESDEPLEEKTLEHETKI